MSIKIGVTEGKIPVRISPNSPNEHIAIFGLSGTGKSTKIEEIMQEIKASGSTVVAFDLSGQDFLNLTSVNRIYANRDGVDLKIFDLRMVENGRESYVNFLSYLVDTFTHVYKLGIRQQGVLRTALEYGIKYCSRYETEMDAIAAGLDGQNSDSATGVHNKLWQLLHGGILRKSSKEFHLGEINVLDFSGINPTAQKELAEFILSFMWKKLRTESCRAGKLCLVIDECQHYLMKSNSVLLEMLRESRKYGVNIILSTQSTSGFTPTVMAAVNQTAVQLFFRPSVSDMKKIADMIAPQGVGRWLLKLKKLNVGECVATGNLFANGKELEPPFVIHSSYNAYNQSGKPDEIKQLANIGR